MSFSEDERAELIAALSKTSEMVSRYRNPTIGWSAQPVMPHGRAGCETRPRHPANMSFCLFNNLPGHVGSQRAMRTFLRP